LHLSIKHSVALDDAEIAINPSQSPADMLVLSFTDSDLACMAVAAGDAENLRLTSLAGLKHPLSVDLYIEQVAAHAKVILVRLLGGYDWWKYGVDELHKLAVSKNIKLIMVSGCHPDARLRELSTAPKDMVDAVEVCLAAGGAENAKRVLRALQTDEKPIAEIIESGKLYKTVMPAQAGIQQLKITIIFYRAHYLAADTAPIDALLTAFSERGISARAFMVASLKDADALSALLADTQNFPPDVIIDATAFSAGGYAHPLSCCNAPILQVALANMERETWQNAKRGLSTTDMAMHIVLPESDGRVFTRAISFKEKAQENKLLEFTSITHFPEQSRIDFVADLGAAWANLAHKKNADKKLAIVLSDYPDRAGRSAYAVGLDAPASANEILRMLAEEGYSVDDGQWEVKSEKKEKYSIEKYQKNFSKIPIKNQEQIIAAWGEVPQKDFDIAVQQSGNIYIALQPDRGSAADKKTGYHDGAMPPRHEYLAFYWWLREEAKIDALIHLGTHGNLEWLPAKTVALSPECYPEIVIGAMPVIYPYIVTDAGEAAQAKRRICAVTISHQTPPMQDVKLSPELAALEVLTDEYSSADGLDGRRMKLLREEIIFRAKKAGLAGTDSKADEAELMTTLEAHLCDIKEQRVGDGLHIFGQTSNQQPTTNNESQNLIAALSGKFIPPTVGGSPARGNMDIFPTGRNLVSIDPRMIPTPTASIIGKRAAEEFVRRYMQDNGDYPKNIVMDIWGSATLRNGGDEIAQALHLMGVNVLWEENSARVSGFEIIPDHEMAHPRMEVTLRISGLFRDMFLNLILLFDDAVQQIAKLQGVSSKIQIFGNAANAYGAGVTELIDSGKWNARADLGNAYIEASKFGYGRGVDGVESATQLKEKIARADALIHTQDIREVDALSGADFADSEGGFAAAAEMLGANPTLYHIDTSRLSAIKARTLAEEISLTLHARALNPDWIKGQMRHGYAGGAEIANVVDNLFAFAATSNATNSEQFDAVADAYLHNAEVHEFLARENPEGLRAIKERLQEAIERGLWIPRRNSTAELLRVA